MQKVKLVNILLIDYKVLQWKLFSIPAIQANTL